MELIEKSAYIHNCLERYKEKTPFPYNALEKIILVKKVKSHEFKGTKFILIRYKGVLKNKNKVYFYVDAASRKNKRLDNRWLFLNGLYNNNFSVPPFLVPKPIIFIKNKNIIFYEEGEGETLSKYIKEKKIGKLKKEVANSAQWLLKFHDLKIKNWKKLSLASEVEEKEFGHFLKIAKNNFSPATCKKIKKILDSVSRHSKSYFSKGNGLSFVHGDFQPPNIVYNEKNNNTIVIDFEWAGIGDPLSDVGNFLLQFDYHSASRLKNREVVNLKNVFLNTYFGKKPLNENFVSRINLYQAKFAIQRAIFNTAFFVANISLPKDESTINLFIKKAEKCYKENKKINLEVYNYHQLITEL